MATDAHLLRRRAYRERKDTRFADITVNGFAPARRLPVIDKLKRAGCSAAIPNHAAALLKALAIHSNRRQSAQNAEFDFPKAARRAPRSGVFRYGGLLWQRVNLAERTIGNEQIDTLALISACSACTGAFAQGSPQPPRPGRGMANDDWAQS